LITKAKKNLAIISFESAHWCI